MTKERAIEILERRTTIPDGEYTWEQINQAIDMAISALRPVSREQVDKLWRGEWEWFDEEIGTFLDGYEREWGWRCGKCSHVLPDEYDDPDLTPKLLFCPNCGAPMSDEAMQMVMERLEALYE